MFYFLFFKSLIVFIRSLVPRPVEDPYSGYYDKPKKSDKSVFQPVIRWEIGFTKLSSRDNWMSAKLLAALLICESV